MSGRVGFHDFEADVGGVVSIDIAAEPPLEPIAEEITPLRGGAYGYAMALIMTVSVVNYIDRQVMNIVAEPIKHDLHLKDAQLGLLTGLAFGVLYTLLGVPIARLAERSDRPRIVAVAAGVWSVFTVLSATVVNFGQLALVRVGVGFGEAGCVSPSHSLIMDYAPREKRGSAMSLFGMTPQMGSLVGLALGGLVASFYSWRIAFVVAGLPGLLLAVLVALSLPEPRRAMKQRAKAKADVPSLLALLRLVAPKRSYWVLNAAITLNVFVAIASGPFVAPFFLRNHAADLAAMASGVHLKPLGFLGLVMGCALGVGGAFGAWSGGAITDRIVRKDSRRYLYGPAAAILLWVPVFFAVLSVKSLGLALGLLFLQGWLSGFWYGPAFVAWLSLVKPNMRATNSALSLFISNLVGLGLGPWSLGLLSDHFAKQMGSGPGLRAALLTVGSLQLLTSFLFWLAAKTFRQDQEV